MSFQDYLDTYVNTRHSSRVVINEDPEIPASSFNLVPANQLNLSGAPGEKLSAYVTLTNNGKLPLSIPPLTADNGFTVEAIIPALLAPGRSIQLLISFTGSTVGQFYGTLYIQTDLPTPVGSLPLHANISNEPDMPV